MRALLTAALLVVQPDHPADAVHGVVLRHDGTPASQARVELRCGEWRQVLDAGSDGTFVFSEPPAGPCGLVAQVPGDASAGVSQDVPASRGQRVAVILPEGITTRATSAGTGLRIDLATTVAPERSNLLGRTRVAGDASWSSGLEMGTPGARPDQWTVAASVTRPGPFGTLFTGRASARRQVGPSTLLSDLTGVAPPNASMWGALFDPTRPTMIYDVRLRLEREFSLGGTDLTIFGEAYRSFQGGSARGEMMQLPPSATKGLRNGSAGRVGVKLGF
ncbi:MAG TPA: hypothetical protein VMF13_18995 [Luteitalea sp.]|nr:hypothetical protein [Luteitalea sp.]